MTRLFTLLLTAGVLLSVHASTFAAEGDADANLDLFGRLDVNSDGKITKGEVPEDKARLFERLVRAADKDGNGSLSKDEFTAGLKESAAPVEGDRGPARDGEPPREVERQRDPARMFSRLDVNGDGQIEASEVPEERREMIDRLMSRADKNGDKKLSRDEFTQAREGRSNEPVRPRQPGDEPRGRRGPPSGQPLMAGPIVRALDKNGDGSISADEIKDATASLKKLDKNNDGAISREEWAPEPPAMAEGGAPNPGLGAMLERLDKDGDKKISRDEAPERVKENFERIDANKDGFLDETELRQARPRQRDGEGNARPEARRDT